MQLTQMLAPKQEVFAHFRKRMKKYSQKRESQVRSASLIFDG
jgi:hypothetical protein